MALCRAHNDYLEHDPSSGSWHCPRLLCGSPCPVCGPEGISDEAMARLASGETYWPGVGVLNAAGEWQLRGWF